ncbi:metal-dependent hydrolase [Congregibacter variabilis]|uniref:Metal-dependent hydrolase n=1 Tax=Congregibacter variabilis TaxID=3081200 RepID=A0ABZ0HZT4_9GAMM|nr:metal-dependent hydrolase [Congregibacter sp. IMCC43200]
MSNTSEAAHGAGADRMTVRDMPFDFLPRTQSWNPDKPEFAHIVNSASLAMPYLEPYLIKSMRKARPLIRDPELQTELDKYIKQEATHYRRHKEFNDTLTSKGYRCVAKIEEKLAKDYAKLESRRSLRFNLAYAEGFESMALAIGEMLIEDREYLFGDSDSAVTSLILWHFVEEIEHKNVAFDVFDHLYGSYFWRIVGLVYATSHIFWRTGQGYRALLKEDGLWQSSSSRWHLVKVLGRVLGNITPKWLRILRPGYHPKQIKDPDWGLAWAKAFEDGLEDMAQLDTRQLNAPLPVGQRLETV